MFAVNIIFSMLVTLTLLILTTNKKGITASVLYFMASGFFLVYTSYNLSMVADTNMLVAQCLWYVLSFVFIVIMRCLKQSNCRLQPCCMQPKLCDKKQYNVVHLNV
jgi:hypothetical protein